MIFFFCSGKSDPFVRATLQFKVPGKEKEKEHAESTLQTKYVEQSLKPSWNETLAWDVTGVMPSSIRLRVIDYDDFGGDDVIGHCVVPVSLAKQPREEWIQLSSDAGYNVFNRLKTSMATNRKEKEKSNKKTFGLSKKSNDKNPLVEAQHSNLADQDGGISGSHGDSPMPSASAVSQDEEQKIQVSTWFKKALTLPATLIVNETRVAGALLALETRFAFLNEAQSVVFEVGYDKVVQLIKSRRLAVLETTEGVHVMSGFTGSQLYAMVNAVSSKFKVPCPFSPKGVAVRMPSVRDLKGLTSFPTGLLVVSVVEANNLIAKDKVKGEYTSSDPYVTVQLLDASGLAIGSGTIETRVVLRSLMPVWDQTFDMTVPQGATAVLFTVFDKDPGQKKNDDFMGQALITADEFKRLVSDAGFWEGWRKLEQRPGRVERVSGSIRVSLKIDPAALIEKEDDVAIGIDV